MVFSTFGAGNPPAVRLPVPVRLPPEGGLGSPSGGAQAAWTETTTEPKAQTQPVDEFQDFGLLSNTDGWILIGRHLYWTGSNGVNWSDITPPVPPAATIYDVKFLDTERGWVLWANSEANGNLVFQIAHTPDRGGNWNSTVIQTLTPDDPDVDVENASMDWFDENTGWVSVKRQTGSNFSSGTLFRTEDGGQTWARLSLPIGGPVYFGNSQIGWMAGGPAGDQLYKTQDGGRTWEKRTLPGGIEDNQSFSLYPPVFDSPENGLLPVVSVNRNDLQVEFFSTQDGGQNWMPGASLPLGSQVGRLPLSLLDARNLVAAVPNSDRIIHIVNGKVKTTINQDGMSAAIVDMNMFSSDFVWAKWNTANCKTQNTANANGSADISCSLITKLIKTVDGGITWEVISLPGSGSDALTQSYNATYTDLSRAKMTSQGNTQLFVGQGFDLCEIPTISQLQSWWNSSPYKTLNLYIGGSARACPNIVLSASYLSQVRQQGWSFIPTWAGPQAPCRPSGSRFSDDVSTAYTQGMDEANLAVESLAALGLTYADKTGSVVYYDMEPYGTNQNCRDAVKAFVNGWVTQLHARGNVAGIYASTGCNTGLSDFLQIANIPDVIWPYRWYNPAGLGSYDPNASVWDLGGCVPTSVWANHQRIRQYEGANNETWGGVTLNIDNDVLDGVVAIPYIGYIAPPSANFYALPLSGIAPLTVALDIVDTSNITSCSWNYGDGQTGTSCASSHNHTYNSSGSYTLSLTVSGPGGSDAMTRNNYIVVSQPDQPDLVPYPRVGRQNPVIISSVTGTSTNGTLYAGQQIYIDWGFKNIGNTDINTNFDVDLYIDTQRFIHSSFTSLSAGALSGFDDWGVTWNTSGWHTVKLIVDPENSVSESNENNNVWTGQFYWESTTPTELTTISPTGTISDTTPAYVWNAVTGIVSYELHVYSLGSASDVFSITSIPASSICSAGICTYNSSTILSPGDYQFMVGAKNLYGTSIFSAWMTFTVGGVPIAPTTVSPTGTIMDTTPSYVWTTSVGASLYDLYVYSYGSASPVVSNSSIPASSNCTTGTCTWTPSTVLTPGSYQFNVRASNLSGVSNFSPWETFTVDAGDYTYRIYLPLVIR